MQQPVVARGRLRPRRCKRTVYGARALDPLAGSAGSGYEYAYLYPGLQKVVQAAGRVIRTTEDQGAVYLLDDRFGQRTVRELLPRWWRIGTRSLTLNKMS